MTTAFWILGISGFIAYGLMCYFAGRDHERNWLAGICNVLEQERDQALLERDESRKLLSNRVSVNSRLRVKMLSMEREAVRLRESLLNARLKLDNRVTAYRDN